MKIAPSLPAAALLSKPQGQVHPRDPKPSPAAAHVTLSADARFVTRIAEEARHGKEIRTDVVERVTAALLDGSFERGLDMDALVERLAREL